MERLGAVILAAGAGTRMGGVAKAMLWLDGVTFLEAIALAARDVGLVDAVVVVGPPHAGDVTAEAERLGLRVAVNARPELGMASSIAIGFAAIAEGDARAAWLWPVDHPRVRRATLRTIASALGDRDVARPIFDGRGGHPPLVARAIWPQLAGCASVDGGARAVIAAARHIDVDVDDPGCVRDIDTLEDL